MDPNSSECLNNLFCKLIEEEFMDNTHEELLMSMRGNNNQKVLLGPNEEEKP